MRVVFEWSKDDKAKYSKEHGEAHHHSTTNVLHMRLYMAYQNVQCSLFVY